MSAAINPTRTVFKYTMEARPASGITRYGAQRAETITPDCCILDRCVDLVVHLPCTAPQDTVLTADKTKWKIGIPAHPDPRVPREIILVAHKFTKPEAGDEWDTIMMITGPDGGASIYLVHRSKLDFLLHWAAARPPKMLALEYFSPDGAIHTLALSLCRYSQTTTPAGAPTEHLTTRHYFPGTAVAIYTQSRRPRPNSAVFVVHVRVMAVRTDGTEYTLLDWARASEESLEYVLG